MNKKRMMLALVVAPIVPSIYFLAMMDFSNRNAIVMMMVYSVFLSHVPTIFLGIPLVSWLRRREHLNLLNVVIGGAIAGIVVFYVFGFVFSAMLDSSRSAVPSVADLIWGAVLGISVALPFSLIAGIPVRKRLRS